MRLGSSTLLSVSSLITSLIATTEASTESCSTVTATTIAKTVVTSNGSPPSSGTSAWAEEILSKHNKYRALHGAQSMIWDDAVAAYAQAYANQYTCSGILTHSTGPYGENLALGYPGTTAVDAWYDEISKYDWSDVNWQESAGHFTQVIWNNSIRLGCGYIDCSAEDWSLYTICSYAPAGNVLGQFSENVFPLL